MEIESQSKKIMYAARILYCLIRDRDTAFFVCKAVLALSTTIIILLVFYFWPSDHKSLKYLI